MTTLKQFKEDNFYINKGIIALLLSFLILILVAFLIFQIGYGVTLQDKSKIINETYDKVFYDLKKSKEYTPCESYFTMNNSYNNETIYLYNGKCLFFKANQNMINYEGFTLSGDKCPCATFDNEDYWSCSNGEMCLSPDKYEDFKLKKERD